MEEQFGVLPVARNTRIIIKKYLGSFMKKKYSSYTSCPDTMIEQ